MKILERKFFIGPALLHEEMKPTLLNTSPMRLRLNNNQTTTYCENQKPMAEITNILAKKIYVQNLGFRLENEDQATNQF